MNMNMNNLFFSYFINCFIEEKFTVFGFIYFIILHFSRDILLLNSTDIQRFLLSFILFSY